MAADVYRLNDARSSETFLRRYLEDVCGSLESCKRISDSAERYKIYFAVLLD